MIGTSHMANERLRRKEGGDHRTQTDRYRDPAWWQGRRVTVMGIGTRGGGVGVIRWLARKGAIVTATDARHADALADAMRQLDGLPIRFVLGGHDQADFRASGSDMIVRNPAIPRRAPLLELARADGVPVEMEMSLFLRLCPASVVGVTGTKGKTTTSSLIAHILRGHISDTRLVGNMGVSALDEVDHIDPSAPVVVELSSWQVESLIEHRLSPHIGVLTNISEDHLNTYDGFDDYASVKRGMFAAQTDDDIAILNADDPEVWQVAGTTAAGVLPFGSQADRTCGAFPEGDWCVLRDAAGELRLPRPRQLALAGAHGMSNTLAAMAVARVLGVPDEIVRSRIATFHGVSNRMEVVAEIDGVTYINDTTATAPIAAIAALRALAGRRVHWIGGGADKALVLDELAVEVASRAATVHLLDGSATQRLAEAVRTAGTEPGTPYTSLSDATMAAQRVSRPGDIVLLSPGCASFGLFRDEFDRGDQFRVAVSRIADHGIHAPVAPNALAAL